MKEPRSHTNLDSQCRFDAISKKGLSNSNERTKREILWRYPCGTEGLHRHGGQRWHPNTERNSSPLTIDMILNQQSLGAIERAAIKVEMESSVAGNGPSDKQCRGTPSSLVPRHMQEPEGLLQFPQLEESVYQRNVCASRVTSNKYLLPGQLSLPRPLIHNVGNK